MYLQPGATLKYSFALSVGTHIGAKLNESGAEPNKNRVARTQRGCWAEATAADAEQHGKLFQNSI